MASCIQQTFDNSKICECTQKDTWSAQMESDGLSQTQHYKKNNNAPLFLNGNMYQVTRFVCRFEATRMKLSLQNSRVTAS